MPITLPPGDTERPVPSWARRPARALPFVLLPHCLWRLPFAVGFTMGTDDPQAPAMPWWGTPYVLGLSLLTEALALLTSGLVSGWGEVFPRWLPLIGGRRVPPLAAVVPATIGGLVLVALFDTPPLAWLGVAGYAEVPFANGWWHLLALVCTTPAMLWGPITLALALALALAYHLRRRPNAASRISAGGRR